MVNCESFRLFQLLKREWLSCLLNSDLQNVYNCPSKIQMVEIFLRIINPASLHPVLERPTRIPIIITSRITPSITRLYWVLELRYDASNDDIHKLVLITIITFLAAWCTLTSVLVACDQKVVQIYGFRIMYLYFRNKYFYQNQRMIEDHLGLYAK